jgi:hypothetical protein
MALTQVVRKASQTGSRGDIVTYTGSDVAANVEWSETVPAGKSWRILAIRATLVTDANVANRRVGVTISDGTNVVFKSNDESVQAASVTHNYNIAPQEGHAVADVEHYTPLPIADDFKLPAGFVIASTTLLRQAGDNWGAPVFMVEEFSL